MPAPDSRDDVARLLHIGRYGAALASSRRSRGTGTRTPVDLDVEEARVLAKWGRLREASRLASRAVGAGARATDDLRELMRTLANAGIAGPEVFDDRFVGEGPGAAILRADWLRSRLRFDEAIPLLRELAESDPSATDVRMALADCLVRTGRDSAALACLEDVVARAPDHAGAWAHIAAIHALAGRYADALAVYATRRDYDARIRGQVLVNLAITRFHTGDVQGCQEQLLAVLPGEPELSGHMQLGPTLLTLGDDAEGWRQYEFRWLTGQFADSRPAWIRPHWNGQDLRGKTILVVREQGIGDCFQFARYLPLLRAAGAKVIASSFDGVESIARRHFGVDDVVREGEPVPEHDYFAFLMSLPRAFGTTEATIPAPLPGLAPTSERARRWEQALPGTDRPRIGVVWAGRPEHLRDRQRSIALAALAPVLRLPGLSFVGLQKGVAVSQCESIPESFDWTGLGPELETLEDAIAVLDRLDGLVTVDTALAHIAGTLGKPVWMLVADPPDFRWRYRGTTTRWYSSMRLHRQSKPGDWSDPVREVADALARFRDARGSDLGAAPGDVSPDPRAGASAPVAVSRPAGLARAMPMRRGFLQYDPDEPLIGPSLERLGEWLETALERVLAELSPGSLVVEANAGVGAHSLPIAAAIGDAGDLIAFEPRHPHRRMLENNLRAHRLRNATVLERRLAGNGVAAEKANADTLDDLALARLDVLVVHDGPDVLASILEGGNETIWRCRPRIFGIGAEPSTLHDAASRARDFGYRVEILAMPVHSQGNFNRTEQDPTNGASCALMIAMPEERA